jgi:hypothetical protein
MEEVVRYRQDPTGFHFEILFAALARVEAVK